MAAHRRSRILAEVAALGDAASSRGLCEASRRITGLTGSGVMLMSGDVPQGSLCTTDEVSALIEELQFTLGEGPCIDAHAQQRVVGEPDLARPAATRWAAFTPQAQGAGVGAVFAFPVQVGGVRLGVLDLYRDRPGDLSDEQHADAPVLADVVAHWVLDAQAGAQPGTIARELEAGLRLPLRGAQRGRHGVGATRGQRRRGAHPTARCTCSPPTDSSPTSLTTWSADGCGSHERAHHPGATRARRVPYKWSATRTRPREVVSSSVREEGDDMSRETVIVQSLVELADTLVDDFDIVDLLTGLANRCVDLLGVSAAGVMLASPGGELRVVASSNETMRVLELFELQASEGPCLDAFRTRSALEQQSLLRTPNQWPRFTPAALEMGFVSVCALPLKVRDEVIGALNLFSDELAPLDDQDLALAQALADLASISILTHRATAEARLLNEQLSAALTSRILIEQAKGVIAERVDVDVVEAFHRLRTYARSHGLRLTNVCQAVLDGTLDHDAWVPN